MGTSCKTRLMRTVPGSPVVEFRNNLIVILLKDSLVNRKKNLH